MQKQLLDGNKFFQRHAAVIGKYRYREKVWCVANILEKASKLKYTNIIVCLICMENIKV